MSQKTEKKFRQMHRTKLNQLAENDWKIYHENNKKILKIMARKVVIWRVVGIAGFIMGAGFAGLFLASKIGLI